MNVKKEDTTFYPQGLRDLRGLWSWLKLRFGLTVAILGVLAFLGSTLWWNWPSVRGKPFVASMVRMISPAMLPHAVRGKMNVAVTHLDGDGDGRQSERLILDELRQIDVIAPLSLDRTITEDAGSEETTALQERTGADVLIWGSVLRVQTSTAIRLYWRPSELGLAKVRTAKYIPSADTVALPPLFSQDLLKVLSLLVHTRLARLEHTQPGNYPMQELRQRIQDAEALIARPTELWNSEDLAQFKWALADALDVYAQQSGSVADRRENITLRQALLKENPRLKLPQVWAAAENNLGNALSELGAQEADTKLLEQAVTAYHAAMEVWTPRDNPIDWATAENNLSDSLRLLGEQEHDSRRLEEAVTAARSALKAWTRERSPVDWAAAQNSLGNAMSSLAEQDLNIGNLEVAVAGYRAALEEWTREREPQDWAMAEYNLSDALRVLGERTSNRDDLEAAVVAARASLTEWTRDRLPLDWAMAQNALANSFEALGKRDAGTQRLEAAVAIYRSVLEVWTREASPLDWATAQNNLGEAMEELGQRETGSAKLDEAINAYRAALEVRTREKIPGDWAETELNLKRAESLLRLRRAHRL
jgi:tetratricopeptide (TPR) repeat protein